AFPAVVGIDLVLVVGLLTLARFATTLAAFDAGSPFGPMSAGRQWFIHVLAEPALLVAAYIFALSAGTTSLPHIGPSAPEPTLLVSYPTLSIDRKSTRLNSSHVKNSYAVFCLKKKK